MDAYFLDTNLNLVAIIDSFESLIWTERYQSAGDFELYLPATTNLMLASAYSSYVQIAESKKLMIIETVELTTDPEAGNYLIVTGRSLESYLERRIMWGQQTYQDTVENIIEQILNANVITPSDPSRRGSNLIFRRSTDPAIMNMSEVFTVQYYGEDLYTEISGICQQFSIGYRIFLEEGVFIFELYAGKDRSYDQVVNPHVVFSPSYDNILESSYLSSTKNYKSTALVAGEGEGSSRIFVEASDGASGWNRRELFIDASSVSSNNGEIPEDEYRDSLLERGYTDLSSYTTIEAFDGSAEVTKQFVYGTDFFLGDIVQIENQYGMQAVSRVTEVVYSYSSGNVSIIPTFVSEGSSL